MYHLEAASLSEDDLNDIIYGLKKVFLCEGRGEYRAFITRFSFFFIKYLLNI